MRKLLTAADYIFQEWNDEVKGKDIGNDFWIYVKSQFFNDSTRKIKVADFVYNHILQLDPQFYEDKYGISVSNIKKSKEQITFVSEIISKMIKHSDIPLVDY